jgi:leader peptidase (prepilin peptidase)/N-methyltransferase
VSSAEIVAVVFGVAAFLAIGSFTCVVIDRLPLQLAEENRFGEFWDTRPWPEVFGGTSRCSSCGAAVRPSQNIPVVSWIALRGRCSSCGERIPGFHPWVELLAPLLFLGAIWSMGLTWQLLPVLWLIPVGLAIAVIDLRTLIVPTRIVWPALLVSVALTVLVAAIEGEWSMLLSALIGVGVLAGPLFVLWFAMPSAMGFGDVRLTVFLGWNLGFYAGADLFAPVILALICMTVAALLGLVIGMVALGLRGRKAKVPFGPALVIATYGCIVLAPQILDPFGLATS